MVVSHARVQEIGVMGLLESSMGAFQASRSPEKRKRLQETLHVPKN
jgi:uncharacterized membrane protein